MLSNILAWDFSVSEQSLDFRSLFGACGGRHRIKLELLVQLPYKNNGFANSHLLDVEKAKCKKEECILQGTRTRLFFTNLILFRLAFVPRRRNLISCSLETRAPFFTGEPLWLLYYEDKLAGKKKNQDLRAKRLVVNVTAAPLDPSVSHSAQSTSYHVIAPFLRREREREKK